MSALTALGILLAHGFGDYVLQTDYMAQEKTKRWFPAIVHATVYTLPYIVVTRSIPALLIIGCTHAVIDRYRLARYLVWLKNQGAPAAHRSRWADCSATGYRSDRPIWLTTWLMIIVDNLVHISINTASIWWLA